MAHPRDAVRTFDPDPPSPAVRLLSVGAKLTANFHEVVRVSERFDCLSNLIDSVPLRDRGKVTLN